MARKKIEPITSLGNEDKLLVQKSKPLFALWQSELTLAEFKILDTYLARIDSHHPERRQVIFGKGELEEKLGVKKINQKELEERLKHLMGNVVKIPDEDEKKGFRLITLFEEAVAEQDDYGLWQVKLECTQKAMKYIFNMENLGYSRYKLRCITSMTSRYTYIMFIYLESHRKMKSWEVSLEELKHILNCDKEELYKEFKFFNQKILKRVQAEMHEKTECRYSYEPIKSGRKVTKIKFTVETITDRLQLEPNEEISAEQSSLPSSSLENELSAYSAVCKNEFSVEQIKLLLDLMSFIDEQQRLSYFQHIFTRLECQASKSSKRIVDRFAYLTQMIKNDYTKFSKEQKQQNASSQKTYGGAYDLEAYENTDPFADE